jgi:hypothetical protein
MTPATRNWIATGRSLGGLPTSILIDLPWKRSTNRASSGVSPAEASKK